MIKYIKDSLDFYFFFVFVAHLDLRSKGPRPAEGSSPLGERAHVDLIIAFAEVRRGCPGPEGWGHERPLAWKAVWHVAAAAAAAEEPAAAAVAVAL